MTTPMINPLASQLQGKVYLVGSGIGNADYLTCRAYQTLQHADVVIYDALTDSALLELLPDHCERLDVGKRGGQPSTPQAEINRLLVHHAQQEKKVVRLKSGDPFIFGRCTSEIEALRAANCSYEVIPGLSSALAAPLLTGIPLTDPVLSQGFVVISAHTPETLNWEALAQIDTLVILMGTRHLESITASLMDQGRSPQTPIAVIRWAGHPQQQLWIATLESIVQKTARQTLSPAVIVVGAVVGLRPFIHPAIPLDN
ncbi:MAG: uroporphyrinogen-III C-methyltransferase [Elainellaceae cyanobacterium]